MICLYSLYVFTWTTIQGYSTCANWFIKPHGPHVYFDWYIRNIFFFGTFGRAIGRSTYHPRFFFLGRRSNRLFPGRVNNFLARFERVNLVDGRFVKVTFVVRMIYIFIFIRSCADGPPIWNIFWRRM